MRLGLGVLLWIPACSSPFPVQRQDSVDSTAVAALGKLLFSERVLSKDSTISCKTCHEPLFAFAETLVVSQGIGVDARRRNAPSLLNIDLQPHFAWDGRARSLKDHVRHAFTETGDMGIDVGMLVDRVVSKEGLQRAFTKAYGRRLDTDGVLDALVTYQQNLRESDSRFDRYYLGGDTTAFNPAERRGWTLFRSLGCSGCHVPVQPEAGGLGRAVFTDYRFHNLGVGYAVGRFRDEGRFEVTGLVHDLGSFKTPSLRNVALTAPYMHDGSLRTLEEVVDFYARGGIPNPQLDRAIVRRAIARSERDDLISFLGTLTTLTDLGAM